MDLLHQFEQYIKTENLFQPKEHLLLAVSGGIDSVVLCELCHQCGYPFAIAHCNFQLRGQESDDDEKWVEALAKKYEVEFFVKKFETENYATENKLGIQVAARELRYTWFKQLMDLPGNPINYKQPHWLITAHHADDNMETILMNFFKGTGINGLKGILPKQNKLLRPLLFAGKADIENFAKENNLSYREDSSNSSDKYTRNYFRNQLIPGLQKVFPLVKENLLHNAERFREINLLYQLAVGKICKKLITINGNEIHIPVLKLLKTPALHSVLYQILQGYGFTSHQTNEAIKLLHSSTGKYILSPTHRVLRNRKWLIISPLEDTSLHQYLIESINGSIEFELGRLSLAEKPVPIKISTGENIALLDASFIKFPLILRKWKQGDYFYPLGMPKKKKLSRFLIDKKTPLTEKQKVWVIESDKKIIWIVGKRIDERVKIREGTVRILQFTLHPKDS